MRSCPLGSRGDDRRPAGCEGGDAGGDVDAVAKECEVRLLDARVAQERRVSGGGEEGGKKGVGPRKGWLNWGRTKIGWLGPVGPASRPPPLL